MDELNEPQYGYNADKDFVTLECWKKARDVKLFFYNEIIPLLPEEEKYCLRSQIQRAAVSITANVSEGYGRFHYKEGIQFYRISRGSLYELKDHLISCKDLKYLTDELYEKSEYLIEEAKKTLNGFINFVRKQIK